MSTLSSQKYSLDALANRAAESNTNTSKESKHIEKDVVTVKKTGNGLNGLVWFIILFIIILVLLFIFRPSLVLSTNRLNNETYLDWGKIILWSIVFALILVFIIWLCTRGSSKRIIEIDRIN